MTKICIHLLRVALVLFVSLVCLNSATALAQGCTRTDLKDMNEYFGNGDLFDNVIPALQARKYTFVVVSWEGLITYSPTNAGRFIYQHPVFVRIMSKEPDPRAEGKIESLYLDFDYWRLVARKYCGTTIEE
jgi:hypothetical protein